MSFSLKNIFTSLFLTSFLVVAFFGFAIMAHASNGNMQQTDCPFSTEREPLCPEDALAMVIQHMSAYQSLFSVPVTLGLGALIALFGILSVALVFFVHPLLRPLNLRSGVLGASPPRLSYNRKLARWLSLFENSPSFS
ncbi:MAG: hypothetical protein WAV50_00570 [Minisyncoccia bacterium]